ncbi:beta-xylosidase [Lentilactobacillus parafarraginis]|uniref:Beta-xylosidase n=1 Tax=Lentilactobacillus parafarraginis TaxID=390842 RepID=A0A5R9CYX7_9LACO|nr:beta-xylosidase [Lentilactobacillus parafarraginis]TLQ21162.1 beta-xylosidase [Lentilactobacillus parafarraginis]
MTSKKLATILGMAVIAGGLAWGYANRASANAQQITISTTTPIRSTADHVASGGLYGLYDGNTPNADLLSPLKPKTFTQSPPDGGQIPNGEPGPGGDFLKVAPLAHKVGAKVIVRLPDIYPKWPYNYSNEQDWLNRVTKMVTQVKNSGNADDVYAFELWNEPNGTWQGVNGNGHDSGWGDFYQVWRDTYHTVKSIMPDTKIVGPSLNSWQPNYMKGFLTMARDSNTLPDIVSWHQWGAAAFPKQAADFEAMEDSLGIKQRPISINEYGEQQELAVPGQMIHYIQNFENVPTVDSADLAFWYNYGRMDNLLTDKQQQNGGYWLYKWYGDMSGQMDKTSTFASNGTLASVANTNKNSGRTSVIFGGVNGDTTVHVTGLSGKSANVTLSATPWYGVDTAVKAPTTLGKGTVAIKNGQISVPVKSMKAASGYQLVVEPGKSGQQAYRQTASQPTDNGIRVEAEDGTLSGNYTAISGSCASGNMFIGAKDHQVTAGSADFLTVKVPKAGHYLTTIGYANGGATATANVSINGHSQKAAVFENTTGWMTAVPNVHGTRQTMQYGDVSLKKGVNHVKIEALTNSAELDYILFTPIK